MIVCLCEGISDREIRKAARRSNGNAEAVMRATGAGTHCGCCRDEVRQFCQASDCDGCSLVMSGMTVTAAPSSN